jgi:hypothetical protein
MIVMKVGSSTTSVTRFPFSITRIGLPADY